MVRVSALTADDPFVAHHLQHNVVVNIADATWWLFGISFVSTATILPVYISHLTTSPVIIGLVPALESLGWYLPQLFTAPFVEGRARVKRTVLLATLAERVPFLLIGGAILLFPPTNAGAAGLALLLFFVLFFLRVFASGVTAIPWQELMARVIPTAQRGRFFAAQRVFGGLSGLVGAGAAAAILARFEFPLNYALCFACCFAAVMVSYFCLAQTREPRLAPSASHSGVATFSQELPLILRRDRNLTTYLAGRALALLGSMATAFLAVHAVEQFRLADSQAALFTGILLATNIVASAAWGWIGDRYGQKLVLAGSLWLYGAGLALAWLVDSVSAYYFIFALVGIGNAGLIISDLALVLEFAPPDRRATYMGIARGVLAPWIFLAPVLGGALLAQFGYGPMILTSLILTAAGLLLVTALVKEPRLHFRPVVGALKESEYNLFQN